MKAATLDVAGSDDCEGTKRATHPNVDDRAKLQMVKLSAR